MAPDWHHCYPEHDDRQCANLCLSLSLSLSLILAGVIVNGMATAQQHKIIEMFEDEKKMRYVLDGGCYDSATVSLVDGHPALTLAFVFSEKWPDPKGCWKCVSATDKVATTDLGIEDADLDGDGMLGSHGNLCRS